MTTDRRLKSRTIAGPLVGILLIASAVVVTLASPASAVQTKPISDESYYVLSSSSTEMATLGCDQGTTDKNGNHLSRLTILDFGGQVAGGATVELINGDTLTNAQVESLAETYIENWYFCIGSDLDAILTFAVATNNSDSTSYYDGEKWGEIETAVNNYVNEGFASQVVSFSGNDIEPDWQGAPQTESWLDGYLYKAPTTALDVDYGSADGCSTTAHVDESCDNGWLQSDMEAVSWGDASLPLPQIYVAAQSSEWTQISWYSRLYEDSSYTILGPLDENARTGTFTAAEAWDSLWTALNAHTATSQQLVFSAGIEDEPDD